MILYCMELLCLYSVFFWGAIWTQSLCSILMVLIVKRWIVICFELVQCKIIAFMSIQNIDWLIRLVWTPHNSSHTQLLTQTVAGLQFQYCQEESASGIDNSFTGWCGVLLITTSMLALFPGHVRGWKWGYFTVHWCVVYFCSSITTCTTPG